MKGASIVLLLLAAIPGFPQVSFEAATVKRLAPGATGIPSFRGGPGTSSPGQVRGAATLKTLVMKAYELKDFQISGPSWMESERYEVAARIPTGADGPTVAAMLRSLLAERFGFVAHREKRKGAILALVVAKGGPKFKATVEGAPVTAAPKLVRGSDGMPAIAPGSDVTRTYEIVIGGSDGIVYKIWWRGDTVGRFADYLSSRLNREVIDLTKLAGRYDFQLAWAIEGAGGEIPRIGPPPDQIESHNTPILGEIGQSLFSAIPAQLGLRLEQRRGVTEVLVVDRVEMNPTGN